MKKILVIDDHPDSVFLLKDRLEREGFEVITAYDGKTGMQRAFNDNPDLVLLDIMMPGIDGLEVCRTLVNTQSTKDIPVILVTGKAEAEGTKEGLQAGAFDYIRKPVNKIELLARINSALKLRETTKLLIEMEKINTFAATVVTANHEIKQPLTLINLCTAAIRREIGKEDINREAVKKRIEFIETAARDINNVLEKFRAIRNPNFSPYVNNIQMVDLDKKEIEKSD
ncbi:MAG: response regulator [Ignavibacteriales bacterium]|nr:response regulator [Ignavibacteriales bacterium]